MELHRYRVGGFVVRMTDDAAVRWNAGKFSRRDLYRSTVWVCKSDGTGDWMKLFRAMNAHAEPQLAAGLHRKRAVLDKQCNERIV